MTPAPETPVMRAHRLKCGVALIGAMVDAVAADEMAKRKSLTDETARMRELAATMLELAHSLHEAARGEARRESFDARGTE